MKPKRFGIGALLLLFSAGICRGEGLQIETSNAALQRLFDTAMERAAANLRDYADGRPYGRAADGFDALLYAGAFPLDCSRRQEIPALRG